MEEKEKRKSSFATAGLVLGIIGLCTSFIPILNNVSAVIAVIGIILAIIALIKKSSKTMAIVAIIVGIVAIIAVYKAQDSLSKNVKEAFSNTQASIDKASGNSTEEILANDVDVSLGEFTITKDEYDMNSTKMTVQVKNKTTEKKSFNIHVEAINENGERIDEDYIYANDLGAGQSQSFDIFTYVQDSKLDNMKKATFKIVDISEF